MNILWSEVKRMRDKDSRVIGLVTIVVSFLFKMLLNILIAVHGSEMSEYEIESDMVNAQSEDGDIF